MRHACNRIRLDQQPDYRVVTQGIEIGAGWVRKAESSGNDYVSLGLAAPESGRALCHDLRMDQKRGAGGGGPRRQRSNGPPPAGSVCIR